jgi:hypothetical protein
LECINILAKTWEENVKPKTTTNFFKKAGFLKNTPIDVENSDPFPKICTVGVSINEEYSQINQSYEDYIDCDEAISVAGKLDDTDQYQWRRGGIN